MAAQLLKVRPAHLVPEGEEIFLCLKHNAEFQKAREDRLIAEREARTPKTWPIWELNPENAGVDIKGQFVYITEAPEHGGRSIRTELYRWNEVEAWRAGRQFKPEALTSDEVKTFKARVKDGETSALGSAAAALHVAHPVPEHGSKVTAAMAVDMAHAHHPASS
jgi:hypothetical protein